MVAFFLILMVSKKLVTKKLSMMWNAEIKNSSNSFEDFFIETQSANKNWMERAERCPEIKSKVARKKLMISLPTIPENSNTVTFSFGDSHIDKSIGNSMHKLYLSILLKFIKFAVLCFIIHFLMQLIKWLIRT